MSASNASLYIARRQFRDWIYFLLIFSIAAHQILISYETLCCHGGGIIMPMLTLPVAESTETSSQIISMWERAWRWRLSPRSPNCLNLNLRSFLCRSTNYPCTQLCGVSARRFGSIVPEHPLAGLHWKYLLASTDFFFFSSNNPRTEVAKNWFRAARCNKWLVDINFNCGDICWQYCIVCLSFHQY